MIVVMSAIRLKPSKISREQLWIPYGIFVFVLGTQLSMPLHSTHTKVTNGGHRDRPTATLVAHCFARPTTTHANCGGIIYLAIATLDYR